MQLIDTEKLCSEINSLKRARNELIEPIIKEYQICIDDTIFQELPFQYGDILKEKKGGRTRYFIYEGIEDGFMILHQCDENGVKNQNRIGRNWGSYDSFEIHKNK